VLLTELSFSSRLYGEFAQVGQDKQGYDQDGNKLNGLQDWWKDFEKKASAEQTSAGPGDSQTTETEAEKSSTDSKSTKIADKSDVVTEKWYSVSQKFWEGTRQY
jgi:hypothetical protein